MPVVVPVVVPEPEPLRHPTSGPDALDDKATIQKRGNRGNVSDGHAGIDWNG